MAGKHAGYRRLALYSSIIFMLPTTVLGVFYLGYVADGYFGTSPWCTWGGLLVGIVGAFVQLFRLLGAELRKKSGDS